MKRSCDYCVKRKVRCDSLQSCQKCQRADPPLECTFLRPINKRGPKHPRAATLQKDLYIVAEPQARRRHDTRLEVPELVTRNRRSISFSRSASSVVSLSDLPSEPLQRPVLSPAHTSSDSPERIRFSTLRQFITVYRSRIYPVWPVVDSSTLLTRLEDGGQTMEVYVMATALCAATMMQLRLPALKEDPTATSARMESECTRAQSLCDYREHPTLDTVLTSFFLHIYHANIENRNSSMSFVQEAISFARLLGLDNDVTGEQGNTGSSVDGQSLFWLLWITGRYREYF